MKKRNLAIIGLAAGLLNGIIGGGAGMLCVPLLKAHGCEEKAAHAYTVATILAASAISTVIYALWGVVDFASGWRYLVGGALAAPVGVLLLNKAKPNFIKKSFSIFMIYCAVRIFADA